MDNFKWRDDVRQMQQWLHTDKHLTQEEWFDKATLI